MKKIFLLLALISSTLCYSQPGGVTPLNTVPKNRTITINGVSQDLSANRSWTIATPSTTNLWSVVGNTIGAGTGSIGTTDNFPVSIITNNITRASFSSNITFSAPVVMTSTNILSVGILSVSGGASNVGYIDLTHTGIAVTTSPSAAGVRQHGSGGNFNWISSLDNRGRAFTGTLTTNRTYALPDASGTVALTSDLSAYQTTVSGGFIPYTSPNSFTSTNAITAASLISTGTESIVGNSTINGSVNVGGGGFGSSALIVARYVKGTGTLSIGESSSGRAALWLEQGTETSTNYALQSDGSNLNINTIGTFAFRTSGTQFAQLANNANGSSFINSSVTIGSNTTPTVALNVVGNSNLNGTLTVNETVQDGILITTTVSNGSSNIVFKNGTSTWKAGNQIGLNQQDYEVYLAAGGTVGTKLVINHTTGNVGIGGVTTANAKLHIGAGSATASTAPLKFTSGTNLTTPENGAMEYNGTNLFFTRTGAARENVVTSVQVNSVSPTSPNRTIQVVLDGVTYYIAAKTTND